MAGLSGGSESLSGGGGITWTPTSEGAFFLDTDTSSPSRLSSSCRKQPISTRRSYGKKRVKRNQIEYMHTTTKKKDTHPDLGRFVDIDFDSSKRGRSPNQLCILQTIQNHNTQWARSPVDTHKPLASLLLRFPPRLAYSLTSVSLIIRYGLGRILSVEHNCCSAGLSKCKEAEVARLRGCAVDRSISNTCQLKHCIASPSQKQTAIGTYVVCECRWRRRKGSFLF